MLQTLANRFSSGNESVVMRALHKAQLIVAVRMGDLAEVRRLIECEGMGVKAKDRVSCGFIGDA